MDAYSPPDTPLDVIYADHELLVVNKPPGLLSVPGKGAHLADCLLARVQETFPTALLVHRLDRDTSGLMVFGLTPHAQRHLGLQFEKRQIKKADKISAWMEATRIAGFTETEANRFFGKPDPTLMDGLDITLRPPVETRNAYTARHNALLEQL